MAHTSPTSRNFTQQYAFRDIFASPTMADDTAVATPQLQLAVQNMYDLVENVTGLVELIERETLQITNQRNEFIHQCEHLKLSHQFQWAKDYCNLPGRNEKTSLIALGTMALAMRDWTNELLPKLDSVLIGWFEDVDFTVEKIPLTPVWHHTLRLIGKALVRRGVLRVEPSIAELESIRLEAQNMDVWKTTTFAELKAEGFTVHEQSQ